MAKMTWAKAVDRLRSSSTNIRCSEMKRILGDLGFEVSDRSSGNHKTYSHPELKDFWGGNFDCGHGHDSKLKPQYVRNVIQVLEQYEPELRAREP
jgi:hypothetical protein